MSTKKLLKRVVWTEKDENRLIQVWEKNSNQIRPFKRNMLIYNKITSEMGGKFCLEEVHTKIRNLKQRYNLEKKEIDLSSGRLSTWKYYNRIHRIIESCAVNNEESITIDDDSNSSVHGSCTLSPQSKTLPTPIADDDVPLTKRIIWSIEDENRIIELWKENNKDLRQSRRKTHVYERISAQMNHKFNRKEVHTKIRNLTARYRIEKKEIDNTGKRPTIWKNYFRVQEIIESRNNFANIDLSKDEEEEYPDQIAPKPKMADLDQSESNSSFDSIIIESPSLSASPSPSTSPISIENDAMPSSSAAKKIKLHYHEEMTKAINEQTEFLKEFGRENLSLLGNLVDDNKRATNEIINLLRDQNETDKLFYQIVKNLLEK